MFAQIGYYICVPFAWLTRLFYMDELPTASL